MKYIFTRQFPSTSAKALEMETCRPTLGTREIREYGKLKLRRSNLKINLKKLREKSHYRGASPLGTQLGREGAGPPHLQHPSSTLLQQSDAWQGHAKQCVLEMASLQPSKQQLETLHSRSREVMGQWGAGTSAGAGPPPPPRLQLCKTHPHPECHHPGSLFPLWAGASLPALRTGPTSLGAVEGTGQSSLLWGLPTLPQPSCPSRGLGGQ